MIKNLRELYQYRALLWSLTVRELRYRIEAPGYRPVEITLVTGTGARGVPQMLTVPIRTSAP